MSDPAPQDLFSRVSRVVAWERARGGRRSLVDLLVDPGSPLPPAVEQDLEVLGRRPLLGRPAAADVTRQVCELVDLGSAAMTAVFALRVANTGPKPTHEAIADYFGIAPVDVEAMEGRTRGVVEARVQKTSDADLLELLFKVWLLVNDAADPDDLQELVDRWVDADHVCGAVAQFLEGVSAKSARLWIRDLVVAAAVGRVGVDGRGRIVRLGAMTVDASSDGEEAQPERLRPSPAGATSPEPTPTSAGAGSSTDRSSDAPEVARPPDRSGAGAGSTLASTPPEDVDNVGDTRGSPPPSIVPASDSSSGGALKRGGVDEGPTGAELLALLRGEEVVEAQPRGPAGRGPAAPDASVSSRQDDGEAPGLPWTRREVEVAVRAYLQMLRSERVGGRFVKSRVRSRVARELPARTEAAIELKFGNITAALDERGLPFVSGYQPYRNRQSLVDEIVAELAPEYGVWPEADGTGADEDELLSAADVAKALHLEVKTVVQWARDGELQAVRDGKGGYLFRASQLAAIFPGI